jgi:hypothetical protein
MQAAEIHNLDDFAQFMAEWDKEHTLDLTDPTPEELA